MVRCYRQTQGLWLRRSGKIRAPRRARGKALIGPGKKRFCLLVPYSLGPCVRPTFEAGAGTPAFWAGCGSYKWRRQLWSFGGRGPAGVNMRGPARRALALGREKGDEGGCLWLGNHLSKNPR